MGMSEAFAGGSEVFFDRCEMFFQQHVKILIHPAEQFSFSA
jgi:hypothetical protein